MTGGTGRGQRGWASLNNRERAILLAVAEGRARMLAGPGCEVTVDGVWCDQQTVRALVEAGLIRPSGKAMVGSLVDVELTAAGRGVVAATTAATATTIVSSETSAA